MYFDIYALIADHCLEHERSDATGDAMKQKLKKIFNYEQKSFQKTNDTRPKSTALGGDSGSLIFPPHQYAVNNMQYSKTNCPEVQTIAGKLRVDQAKENFNVTQVPNIG